MSETSAPAGVLGEALRGRRYTIERGLRRGG